MTSLILNDQPYLERAQYRDGSVTGRTGLKLDNYTVPRSDHRPKTLPGVPRTVVPVVYTGPRQCCVFGHCQTQHCVSRLRRNTGLSHEASAMFTEFFRSWKGPKAHQPRMVACSDNPCVRRKAAYVIVDDSASDESNVDATMGEPVLKNGVVMSRRAKKNFNPATNPQTVSLQNGESMSTGPYNSRAELCAAVQKFMGCKHAMHQSFSGGNVSHYCCSRVDKDQAQKCLKNKTPFSEHLVLQCFVLQCLKNKTPFSEHVHFA